MKTGILFDLDGTLLDTLQDLADGTNYALRQFGCPERTLEEIRKFVGNGALNLMTQAVPNTENAPTPQELLAVFKPYYEAHCQVKTAPYPGVVDALTKVAEQYPVAIVSNKPDGAVKALCAEYFPGIYALGETPDCPRKPAPDMVYKAMAQLGVDRCVYVGDSEVDIITAKNAGVPCLSVLWGFRDKPLLEETGGRYFCSKAETLPGMLETIIGEQNGK
jgi:phosphoglycolate phosphatase